MTEATLSRRSATVYPVLGAASACHMVNDLLQSLLIAAYPIFRGNFDLSFAQIGLLTLAYNLAASLLQPLVGHYTDRHPQPFSLPVGMTLSMSGLLVLAYAPNYPVLLMGGVLLGTGSSIFHPESSRLARLASGGAHGLAQSIFQVGGNIGSALGPLCVAFFVLPYGQHSLAWFALIALCGIAMLTALGRWYQRNGHARRRPPGAPARHSFLTPRQVGMGIFVLLLLVTTKYFYMASFSSYYIFYLTDHFRVSPEDAQLCLFVFLAAVAVGTLLGGPASDRFGGKAVIWGSILGVLPFSLVLPYVGLPATIVLSMIIGMIISSAFSAIVVYAQELLPGRIGMVSGLFFGLAFGMGGLGAALLGVLADWTSIETVYAICAFLPALGLLGLFLPPLDGGEAARRGAMPASRAAG